MGRQVKRARKATKSKLSVKPAATKQPQRIKPKDVALEVMLIDI